MSQYADGGMMTTKPYFSGSNYLKKMSNYSPGEWQKIWDSLYWRFITKHHALVKSNARLNFMSVYLARMNPVTIHEHVKRGNIFIKTLNNKKK
jgi:deoxyribodipyrimidine photolyase-related protein